MTPKTCILIGATVDSGKDRQGCLMGPDAYRVAGLPAALTELGHTTRDLGNLTPDPVSAPDDLPAHLHAAAQSRPQFVLWLDAHSDFHTPQSSASGNLHGTPLAYITGNTGFTGFPKLANPIPEENICILGLRSVDGPERDILQRTRIRRHDMREIDETGIAKPLSAFLAHVARANGMLHVSLDVDFLDPGFAPAVGTTVPGGATIREAHLVMEMICDSGLMTSLDLVELNPFLDDRGRTAQVMVDLTASAFGRRVFDRPTQAFA